MTKRLAVVFAMTRAKVVLPVPGGPERIIEDSWSFCMARLSRRPGPTMCSCPANSSMLRGRIRDASGSLEEPPDDARTPWAEEKSVSSVSTYSADQPDQVEPFQSLEYRP